MSHTNETANLGLPQFIDTDQPTWLGDVNVALQKIDTKAGAQDGLIDGAAQNASAALNIANQASATANAASSSAISAHEEAVLAEGIANNALTVANNTAALAQKLVKNVLWKNTEQSSSIEQQTIELNDEISNYEEIEIIFGLVSGSDDRLAVGYSRTLNNSFLIDMRHTSVGTSGVSQLLRSVSGWGTSATITVCYQRLWNADGYSSIEYNSALIPLEILGYNTIAL